jgi:hypothetical protein
VRAGVRPRLPRHRAQRRHRLIPITLSTGRSLDEKRLLYRRIADRLAEAAARRDGVWVNLLRS